MSFRDTIKKIWFSVYDSGRIVLLDYKIKPQRIYKEETNQPHKKLFEIINKNRSHYEDLLKNTLNYKSIFASIKEQKSISDEIEPGWNNNYLPGLDFIMLYSLIAQIKPSKYIEIGSGVSTQIVYKSRKENALNFEITTIDNSPRKDIIGISDKHYNSEIQNVSVEIFERLKENDIVFLDGTHTLFPNSDVMWFFLEIFPRLPKGVIVHIHDVYLPYDYPDFMCERYYNEQYLLAALLLSNSEKYEIISPNYFCYSDKDLNNILKPIFDLDALNNVERHGGSFWFKI